MRRVAALLSAVLLCAVTSSGQEAMDSYGGWKRVRSVATQQFRAVKSDGRWWFIDPDGNAFLSLGVNAVSLSPDATGSPEAGRYREAARRRYGNRQDWAVEAVRRLKAWGFNTVGVGSDGLVGRQGLPYTATLDLTGGLEEEGERGFPDVFSPAFAREVKTRARRTARALANDRLLVGYFTDDGRVWGASAEALFACFLRLGDSAPGRVALLKFLEDRYLQIEQLNETWGAEYGSFAEIGRVPQVGAAIPRADPDDFQRLVAEQYFTLAQSAVRSVDRTHLLLGPRFSGLPPAPVLQAMRGHVNVVSLASREDLPPAAALREAYRLTQCPILLSEFGGGLGQAKGREGGAETQKERGQRYARYLHEALALPMVIGCHWQAYADPAEGAELGLVNLDDEPYQEFVASVTAANQQAYTRHLGGESLRPPTSPR